MDKTSKIFIKIGVVIQLFTAVMLILLTVVCFIISSPIGTNFIVEGLQNHIISYDGPESDFVVVAQMIQYIYMWIAIGALIFSLIFITSNVLNFLAERRNSDSLYKAAYIFSWITFTNVPLIIGYYLRRSYLKDQQNNDVVELNDKDY